MPRRTGLGRGLEALIPQGEEGIEESHFISSGSVLVPIQNITPNPRQTRTNFNSEELSELEASIREHGILQPLIVTPGPKPDQYILIAGERRLMAARQANLREVPVVIRDSSEEELVELALVENLQRADLNPLETAEAYHQLNEEFGLSHEVIASRVGKSRTSVTNILRLLKLPAIVKQAITEGSLSEGHARVLLTLPSPQSQMAVLRSIQQRNLNVRQTEELVRKLMGKKPVSQNKPHLSPELNALQDRLQTHLGTRVQLRHRKKGGSLVIHYYSQEELNALITLILGE